MNLAIIDAGVGSKRYATRAGRHIDDFLEKTTIQKTAYEFPNNKNVWTTAAG
jgi:hypothetical protein